MKGRFAPSPTGYMHLGNLWVALIAYISVKQQGGTLLLRIEDIDRERSREGYSEALMDDLEWIGLYWDEGPRVSPEEDHYFQSRREHVYRAYMDELRHKKLVYPCFCNRSRLLGILSAPHLGDERHIYDGHCRRITGAERSGLEGTKPMSWRVALEDTRWKFHDRFQGDQEYHLLSGADDFIVGRGMKTFSYQLGVSVDDALMGVTEVIRGRDLLDSTPLQMTLLHMLQLDSPSYGHVPLLLDKDGYRLSKRQGGITIKELREAGLIPGEIVSRLAFATGLIQGKYKSITVDQLVETVYLERDLPKNDVILTNFDIVV